MRCPTHSCIICCSAVPTCSRRWGWKFPKHGTNTFEAIAGAVRAGRSVAVKALPGQMPEAFGDFRYVRLCAFLFGRVFPGHDRICEEEGEWMRQAVFGRQESFDQLKEPSRRILDYYDNLK